MLRTWTLGITFLSLSFVAACGGRTPLNPYDDGGPPDANARCDRDRDGYLSRSCGGDDCNDGNGDVNPGVAERCFDGRDNNCNGLTDCADRSCAGIPECGSACVPSREICGDGVDNDCDLLFDCSDPDCAGDPVCGECFPGPERDCGNGVDDDCNGAVDCEDPACRAFPECGGCIPSPERCFNGVDDDCDGAFDCEDSDCSFERACGMCEPRPELCANGVDDDCDGAPDCADSDCAGAMSCAGRTCPNADLRSRLGDVLATGSTRGAPNDYRGGCGDNGPERTFRWRAPRSGRYVFDTSGSRFDTVLYLMAGCGGRPFAAGACNDDALTSQARLTWELRGGQTVIVVVDGFGGDQGDFVLSIRPAPTSEVGPQCFNGIDDDADGLIDCEDPDCAGNPGCGMVCTPGPEVRCSNGLDDDCDGAPDCADPDCAGTPDCGCVPSRERCGNRVDDDCDGLIDCADPDCASRPICGPTTGRELGVAACTNGRDDDGDGRIDCADPDCSPFGTGPDNECCNGLDDNGDGQVDEFTCRCFNDAQCVGVGSLEQTCWTGSFHVCGARCDFYGGDSLCTEFFGPDWRCVGTQCLPPGGTAGGGTPPPP
ncbi:MAG: hypothetical protein GXP55_02115 [Deltaproteobacteria bacterium]|nr:hypothetical protein [Deltaproteobacteria bacterium]